MFEGHWLQYAINLCHSNLILQVIIAEPCKVLNYLVTCYPVITSLFFGCHIVILDTNNFCLQNSTLTIMLSMGPINIFPTIHCIYFVWYTAICWYYSVLKVHLVSFFLCLSETARMLTPDLGDSSVLTPTTLCPNQLNNYCICFSITMDGVFYLQRPGRHSRNNTIAGRVRALHYFILLFLCFSLPSSLFWCVWFPAQEPRKISPCFIAFCVRLLVHCNAFGSASVPKL